MGQSTSHSTSISTYPAFSPNILSISTLCHLLESNPLQLLLQQMRFRKSLKSIKYQLIQKPQDIPALLTNFHFIQRHSPISALYLAQIIHLTNPLNTLNSIPYNPQLGIQFEFKYDDTPFLNLKKKVLEDEQEIIFQIRTFYQEKVMQNEDWQVWFAWIRFIQDIVEFQTTSQNINIIKKHLMQGDNLILPKISYYYHLDPLLQFPDYHLGNFLIQATDQPSKEIALLYAQNIYQNPSQEQQAIIEQLENDDEDIYKTIRLSRQYSLTNPEYYQFLNENQFLKWLIKKKHKISQWRLTQQIDSFNFLIDKICHCTDPIIFCNSIVDQVEQYLKTCNQNHFQSYINKLESYLELVQSLHLNQTSSLEQAFKLLIDSLKEQSILEQCNNNMKSIYQELIQFQQYFTKQQNDEQKQDPDIQWLILQKLRGIQIKCEQCKIDSMDQKQKQNLISEIVIIQKVICQLRLNPPFKQQKQSQQLEDENWKVRYAVVQCFLNTPELDELVKKEKNQKIKELLQFHHPQYP